MLTKETLVILATLSCIVNAISSESDSRNSINEVPKKKLTSTGGALYPQASETRDVIKLDGIWNFRKSPSDPEVGYRAGWYEQDLDKTGPVIPMPVPSSYNDVGEDITLRDHVGVVWYDRRFYVPYSWGTTGQRVWLRFSSVHYAAEVFVNGKSVLFHEIGHLPFETEITDLVKYNTSNLLTVVVDNTLLSDTIPQGAVKDIYSGPKKIRQEQTYTFDFFNYAGIHRSVYLYSTPETYIDDVIVNTDIQGLTGFIVYNITYRGLGSDNIHCLVEVFDKNDTQVAGYNECAGLLEIGNAKFWFPHLMHPEPGYLYTFKVSLIGTNGDTLDTYSQKIGIRTVTWSNSTIYLNGKTLYMKGFGMHEDSDLRGKGFDPVLWVKNFNLIKWLGANAFRTSHYPYAEEIYQLADEYGIMVIDECPGVDIDIFTNNLLTKHKQSITEMIRRDKNHPSVIMWSIANEPRSGNKLADKYFGATEDSREVGHSGYLFHSNLLAAQMGKDLHLTEDRSQITPFFNGVVFLRELVRHVKSMDLSRPVTIAISVGATLDKSGRHLDVISFNRYNGWYANPGSTVQITHNVIEEATNWHRLHSKPVLMSEYGADTIAGLHLYPEFIWSEEYQCKVLSEHFKAFDHLRQAGFFAGEFIWNFADFKTAQSITRVGGNKKGIFTRNRQPKAAAHHIRARYHALATSDYGSKSIDTSYYVSDGQPVSHIEL